MQQNIQAAINDVLDLQDLVPSSVVNIAMTNLVNSAMHGTKTELDSIDTSTILRIRDISAKAETEMEKFWAKRIIASPDAATALASFPYLDNYTELTKRELKLVKESGLSLNSSHITLMIGSGPLPLTAFEMHRQSGAVIDHVDSSSEAIELCEKISQILSMQSDHYHATGEGVVLDKKYDLILLAALAGSTQREKQVIINNVLPALAANGRIVVRSARGSRELLYPAVDAKSLQHVTLLGECHPDDHVINSVLVYERK